MRSAPPVTSRSLTPSLCSVSVATDVIDALRDYTPLIVDLDETLFLRNSTEEYLNNLQPRFLGAVLLIALDVLKPWHWLPKSIRGDQSRDWIRVVIATVLFPWSLVLWSKHAKKLTTVHKNPILWQALNESRSRYKVLATLGFAPIVTPLVKHLGVDWDTVVASRFWRGAVDRNRGKLALLEDNLGPGMVKQAVLVTDPGEQDDLLGRVATACCVAWPGAKYIPAMSDVYIPLTYVERVKHSELRYVRDIVLGDEVPLILLASIWMSSAPMIHTAAVVFLVFSFWCVYEAGYYENDRVAARFEKDPVLSPEYKRYEIRISNYSTWMWAGVIAMPGLALLQYGTYSGREVGTFVESFAANMATWFAFLICVRLTFWSYNYADKRSRSWIYPLLQLYRYCGCLVILPTNLFGAMLLSAQALTRWFSYVLYRHVGGEWPQLPEFLMRLAIVVVLIIAITVGRQWSSDVIPLQILLTLLYLTFRARKQLRSLIQQAGPITKKDKKTTKVL